MQVQEIAYNLTPLENVESNYYKERYGPHFENRNRLGRLRRVLQCDTQFRWMRLNKKDLRLVGTRE